MSLFALHHPLLASLPSFSTAGNPSGPSLFPPLLVSPSMHSFPGTNITTKTSYRLPPSQLSISQEPLPCHPSLFKKLYPGSMSSWANCYLSSDTTTSSISVVILPESSYHNNHRKKRQIKGIATWVQVFSSYMLMLATKHPEALPELIFYQLLIVQHSQRFWYPSWLRYDIDFWTWATPTGTHVRSQINSQCYDLAFTGQGSSSLWYPICFIDGGSHTIDCPNFTLATFVLNPKPPGPYKYMPPTTQAAPIYAPLATLAKAFTARPLHPL